MCGNDDVTGSSGGGSGSGSGSGGSGSGSGSGSGPGPSPGSLCGDKPALSITFNEVNDALFLYLRSATRLQSATTIKIPSDMKPTNSIQSWQLTFILPL